MVAAADEIRGRLRNWPRATAGEPRVFVQTALQACCSIFESPAAVLAWDDPEEPWVVVASLRNGEFTWEEEHEPLQVISDRIRAEMKLAILLEGQSLRGNLFVDAPVDDLTLLIGDAVGLLMSNDMDHVMSVRAACREAVHEERMRVARDLHDGLLQSFTGMVLQLESLHSIIQEEPEEARRLITNIQGLIMADQRDLRAYVEQLRPRRRVDMPFDFLSRLSELKSRFEAQWGIQVTIENHGIDPLVAQSLGPETFRIIQEAVTNSAKHGGATRIDVLLSTAESRIWIEVADDGGGFPFHGKLSLEEIRVSGVGPSMLAERVAALNGDLALESTGSGAKLRISIPLGWSAA